MSTTNVYITLLPYYTIVLLHYYLITLLLYYTIVIHLTYLDLTKNQTSFAFLFALSRFIVFFPAQNHLFVAVDSSELALANSYFFYRLITLSQPPLP